MGATSSKQGVSSQQRPYGPSISQQHSIQLHRTFQRQFKDGLCPRKRTSDAPGNVREEVTHG